MRYSDALCAAMFTLAVATSSVLVPYSDAHADDVRVTPAALRQLALEHIQPLPERAPGAENDNAALVHLGKTLFNERLLSVDVKHACSGCHRYTAGVGGLGQAAVDKGANDTENLRNTPTVLNVVLHSTFNWDGGADSLAAQMAAHLLDPAVMGMPSSEAVMKRLNTNPSYSVAFKVAFRDSDTPMTFEHTLEALAAYQRTLITRDRLDDFLNGDDKALSATEQGGLKRFIDTGCVECHNGPLLGGNGYARFGRHGSYESGSVSHDSETHDAASARGDLGRFRITQKEADVSVFKIPTLRNVALTAPYFHDGCVERLDEAVNTMAQLQLDKKLSEDAVREIVAFLQSVTDKRQL